VLQKALRATGLIFILVVSSFSAELDSAWGPARFAALGLLSFICGVMQSGFWRRVGGFILPLSGAVVEGGLPFTLSCLLLGTHLASKDVISHPRNSAAAQILFFAFLIPAIHTLTISFDPSLVGEIAFLGGLTSLREVWQAGLFPALRALTNLSGIILLLYTAAFVIDEKRKGQFLAFSQGLSFSVTVTLLLVIAQSMELSVAPSLGEFWRKLGRYSGGYQDPNALGVASALLIFIISWAHADRPHIKYGLLAITLILGLVSGSRTFMLGALLFLAFSAWTKLRAKRPDLNPLLVASVAILTIAGVGSILSLPSLNLAFQELSPFVALDRALMTLHSDQGREMFFSRSVFSKIAFEVFLSQPLFGVGLEGFYGEQVRAMSFLGIDLHGWLDNANNFYLQLLSEGGIFSLCLLLSAFIMIRRSFCSEADIRLVAGLAVFFILLLTGPHHLFPEVILLTGILLGGAIGTQRDAQISKAPIIAGTMAVIALSLLWYSQRPRARGLYPADSPFAPEVRWSGREVKVSLCSGAHQFIEVRSQYPRLAKRPQRLELEGGGAIELKDTTWRKVPLSSTGEANFTVVPVWRPERRDPRWLGVQLRLPGPLC
jgi:O-antigen ligase